MEPGGLELAYYLFALLADYHFQVTKVVAMFMTAQNRTDRVMLTKNHNCLQRRCALYSLSPKFMVFLPNGPCPCMES